MRFAICLRKVNQFTLLFAYKNNQLVKRQFQVGYVFCLYYKTRSLFRRSVDTTAPTFAATGLLFTNSHLELLSLVRIAFFHCSTQRRWQLSIIQGINSDLVHHICSIGLRSFPATTQSDIGLHKMNKHTIMFQEKNRVLFVRFFAAVYISRYDLCVLTISIHCDRCCCEVAQSRELQSGVA
ncbi:hypothetical protein HanPSC8_Chr09g0365911 [Helianthus annuus]|nr:hypothetical protein HanPSC8_Chr09g0365911 [Helianthus annuus]